MARHSNHLIAAGVLGLAMAVPQLAIGAGLDQTLYVIVSNSAQVPDHVLTGGTRELVRIYRAIGVELVVTSDVAAIANAPFVAVSIVSNRDCKHLRFSEMALGSALPGGTLAYVMYDRVATFAGHNHTELAETLGIVMAHEIGHLLLPKNQVHASLGLMAAWWSIRELQLANTHGLGFTSREGGMIRERLVGRD